MPRWRERDLVVGPVYPCMRPPRRFCQLPRGSGIFQLTKIHVDPKVIADIEHDNSEADRQSILLLLSVDENVISGKKASVV